MLLSIQHSKQNGLKLDAAYPRVHIFLKFSRTFLVDRFGGWLGVLVGCFGFGFVCGGVVLFGFFY